MLNFRPLQLEDKLLIESFLKNQNYRSSDLTFANLYCWKDQFLTEYDIYDNHLFLRFVDNAGRKSYMMPMGQGDLKEPILKLIKEHNPDNRFQIRALTESMIQEIETAMPKLFDYCLNRSMSDYIYTSNKLINLSGKKLQSKRNHINHFSNEYQWEYKSLSGNTTVQRACREMLDKWMELYIAVKDPTVIYDDKAAILMLDNFDYLQLRGGAIYVNDKIVAFSIGEPLTSDTFITHIEKAYADINGAYAIINQQIAKNEAQAYEYINREEDDGIENLRISKLSYHPDILLHKYVARLRPDNEYDVYG